MNVNIRIDDTIRKKVEEEAVKKGNVAKNSGKPIIRNTIEEILKEWSDEQR